MIELGIGPQARPQIADGVDHDELAAFPVALPHDADERRHVGVPPNGDGVVRVFGGELVAGHHGVCRRTGAGQALSAKGAGSPPHPTSGLTMWMATSPRATRAIMKPA